MLGPDGEPLARRYYAEKTGKDLEAEEMVRGYEIDNGKFVTVSDEELERLAPEKTRDINLTRFVKEDAIPPVYFERGYFLTPAGNSEKAYRLLAEAMKERKDVGIATFVMRGKGTHRRDLFGPRSSASGDNEVSWTEVRSCQSRSGCRKRRCPGGGRFESLKPS
jgi:Ku protein